LSCTIYAKTKKTRNEAIGRRGNPVQKEGVSAAMCDGKKARIAEVPVAALRSHPSAIGSGRKSFE
jgi:hypothetical protein